MNSRAQKSDIVFFLKERLLSRAVGIHHQLRHHGDFKRCPLFACESDKELLQSADVWIAHADARVKLK